MPDAVTLRVAVDPDVIVWLAGCTVMDGATVLESALPNALVTSAPVARRAGQRRRRVVARHRSRNRASSSSRSIRDTTGRASGAVPVAATLRLAVCAVRIVCSAVAL